MLGLDFPNTISDDRSLELRLLIERILHSDESKPVFLRGPRRLGKTSMLSMVEKMLGKPNQIEYTQLQLADPQIQSEIIRWSPSFQVLKRLQAVDNLDELTWREFEELAAELLQQDGYEVELGPGRGDGGVDIIAIKDLGELGLFKAIWQAKKMKPGNKVGISVIRELADTRIEHKASKGILLTSTYLTRGALQRVQRDEYMLGKVDRDDLLKWIERVERGHRR